MTKIDIFSGFLGAGKTTLIKKLIKESFAGQKVVLIENEFGEIGIDGGFLKESGIQINELNAGCICCSLVGDFRAALQQVVEQYHPDRIVIEPSGVGKLSDVTRAVEGVAEHLDVQLSSFVTVADVNKVKMYMKNFGEFYNNQIEAAGTIILSRTQKMTQEKLEAAVSMLREKNADAAIITTPWDELDGKAILSAIEKVSLADELLEKMRAEHEADEHEHHHHHHDGEECDDPNCSCHHHHHHADEVFTSWGKETPKVFAQADIERILTALDSGDYGKILRAKGIVNGEGGKWIEFDFVPEEHEVRAGHPDYTGRLCVIGAELQEDKLAQLFGL